MKKVKELSKFLFSLFMFIAASIFILPSASKASSIDGSDTGMPDYAADSPAALSVAAAPTVNQVTITQGDRDFITKATQTRWQQLTPDEQTHFNTLFSLGQNADLIPRTFKEDSAFAYALGIGNTRTVNLGTDIKIYIRDKGEWQTNTLADNTGRGSINDPYIKDYIVGGRGGLGVAVNRRWDEFSPGEKATFETMFSNGQHADWIPRQFKTDSAFAYALGIGNTASSNLGSNFLLYNSHKTGSLAGYWDTQMPADNTGRGYLDDGIVGTTLRGYIVGRASTMKWDDLNPGEKALFQVMFSDVRNANLIPIQFKQDSAFAYALGLGNIPTTNLGANLRIYKCTSGYWSPITPAVVSPGWNGIGSVYDPELRSYIIAAASNRRWGELNPGEQNAFQQIFSCVGFASLIPARFKQDCAFAYALGIGNTRSNNIGTNIKLYERKDGYWQTATPDRSTLPGIGIGDYLDSNIQATMINSAATLQMNQLSPGEQIAFNSTFSVGSNHQQIPNIFNAGSAFASFFFTDDSWSNIGDIRTIDSDHRYIFEFVSGNYRWRRT